MAALLTLGCAGRMERAKSSARYYVDSISGEDGRSGAAPRSAWKSLERVNAQVYQPGDEVLLRRGGRWAGTLEPRGSGAPGRSIRIGAFGDGPRPFIDGGSRPAVVLDDVERWVVEDLELTNDAESGQDALKVRSGLGWPRRSSIHLRGCVTRDAGGSGIHVGDGSDASFDDVIIDGCVALNNRGSGIFVQGRYTAEQNGSDRICGVAVRGSEAHGNGADGIKVYSAEDVVIEGCTASGNGWREDARVGIWCWNSADAVIQLCESFDNRTPGTQDGGGFDIDWSCERCVIQHCFSHDNDGAGFLFMGAGATAVTRDSAVRFNLSVDDGRRNDYGGIVCFGDLRDSSIHGNAIHQRVHPHGPPIQFRGDAGAGFPSGVQVFKNLFSVEEGELLRVPAEAAGNNSFDRNVYCGPKEAGWSWAGKVCSTIEELRQASGQELHGSSSSASSSVDGTSQRTGVGHPATPR